MKKFLSMLLSFAMLFSLTMPAMAAEVTGNTTGNVTASYTPSSTEDTTKTIYFDNTGSWNTVYAFAWNDSVGYFLGAWPGTAMTPVDGETSIYSIEVPTGAVNVIFNNGGFQTDNLTIPTGSENLYTYSTGEWSVYSQGSTEPTEPTESTYSVVGSFSEWNTADESMVMTWNEENNRYELVLTDVATGSHEYKVIKDMSYSNGTWNDQGDGTDNATFTVKYAGSTVTITFDGTKTDEIVTPPTITGVSITVDDVTYDSTSTNADTPAVITPATQSIILTVTGSNLTPAAADNIVHLSIMVQSQLDNNWNFNEYGTSATRDLSNRKAWFEDTTTAFEIKYSNDGGQNWIGSGVYVIYNDTSAKPTYDVTVNSKGEGTVTLTDEDGIEATRFAEGETVTVTLSPAEGYTATDFEVSTSGSFLEYVKVDDTTYTFTMQAEDVLVAIDFCLPGTDLTTIYYKGDWTNVSFWFINSALTIIGDATGTMVENGIYSVSDIPKWAYYVSFINLDNEEQEQHIEITIPTDGRNMYDATTGEWTTYIPSQTPEDVTSANIVWGSMAFTYTDDNGWANDGSEGAGTVTVTNTGETTFTAQAVYNPESGYTEIEGVFDAASAELAAAESKTFTLTLKNKPAKAITAGTKIGSVTITINEAAEG